jgi:hypothetical protein
MSLLGFVTDTSEQLAKNYADWVTKSKHRSLSLRKQLARAIEGSGYSSWPTPEVSPRAANGGRKSNNPSSNRGGQSNLADDATTWPTPTARDHKDGECPSQLNRNTPNLSCQAVTYSHQAQTLNGQPSLNTSGLLSQQIRLIVDLFNPPCERFSEVLHRVEIAANDAEWLGKLVTLFPPKRKLNPAFVCWLMGCQWWWTRAERISFAAAEMDAYRSSLQSRLSNFFSE